ncbi:MAG: bifunctional folylpolyglutamate synthase/dihydrofolate synthase [Actinomycetota bacterium]|nr:bifunctional folylpolyglutamate synthase/dihydrofolate synthase [Actinomycetota bacterium]
MKPGLERIARLMEMMAEPQRGYPSVHISGSNGKTSTAWITTSVLAAHGLTVGTFTSPHLERVEERIALNGVPLAPQEFGAAIGDVEPFAELLLRETGEQATYFELVTAAAFAWFAERAVDVGVVEVGLGGRLDSTNVLRSEVAAVTGVSLEHTHVLGGAVAEIAAEKLAICKPGSVLVTGALPEDAERVAAARSAEVGAPWRRYGVDFHLESAAMAVGGWRCDVAGVYHTYQDLHLQLHGRHQTRNLAVALAACEELFGRALSEEATRDGVRAARSPGRLEVVNRSPLVLLDGAHNPEAFEVLGRSLAEEFPDLPWRLVVGVLGDKDFGKMLSQVAGQVREVFATAAISERALPASQVAAAAREAFGSAVPVHEVATVPEAVTRALASSGPDDALLVSGSLYVVGEARTLLMGGRDRPPTATIAGLDGQRVDGQADGGR